MIPTIAPTRLAIAVAVACGALGATAHAFDARAVARGGSVIADGEGVPGAWANPASLMTMQRAGQKTHVSLGFAGQGRDPIGVQDVIDDNKGLAGDIEDEVDRIDASDVTCEPFAIDADGERIDEPGPDNIPAAFTFDDDQVCLDGLSGLSTLSEQAIEVFDEIDGERVAAQGGGGIGLGFTGPRVPFALHVQFRATGFGELDVSDNDRAYVADFRDIVGDDELTFGEIRTSEEFDLDPEPPYPSTDGSAPALPDLQVQMPEERLDSRGDGGVLGRLTFGASLATSVVVAGQPFDVGVTPKISSLVARSLEGSADEAFDDSVDFEERFDDSEVTDTSFTFDVGAATVLPTAPLRLAAVLRNVVPETLETRDGFEFETTPQLVVGGLFTKGAVALNADLALNEAKVDGLETRTLAFGVEFTPGTGLFALRGGINHDTAREEAATALTLGLGIGPFDAGLRTTSLEHTLLGAQLSFSF